MNPTTTTTTTVPAVTARHLLQTLEHPDSVCVWLAPIADVEVTVLTAAQEAEARIAVLFGFDEVVDLLLAASGDWEDATALANLVIGRQHAAGYLS
jgi:hypothetical protein